jgi:large subunit ribosomal protein L24
MEKQFSTKWNASTKPRKQRKYRFNAPLHIKHKFMAAHLSKELRAKYKTRSMPAVKGDKVKVLIGQYKGRENKIERVDVKNTKVYITGVERTKRDGSKSMYPIHPSNVIITDLKLDDKKRKEALERKTKSREEK